MNARCFLCGVPIVSDGLAIALDELADLRDALRASVAVSCSKCVGPVLALWLRVPTRKETGR